MDNFYHFQQYVTNFEYLSQCKKFKWTERPLFWCLSDRQVSNKNCTDHLLSKYNKENWNWKLT